MKKLPASFYVSLLVFWGVVISVRVPAVARAAWMVDEGGYLVWQDERVLGRGDGEDEAREESKGSSFSGLESEKKDAGDRDDKSDGEKDEKDEEIKDEREGRSEVRFGEGERIRTRREDGRVRTEVRSGGVKVRLERRDDRVVIKAEEEGGEEEEMGEQEIFKIRERADKNEIEVKTDEGGRFVVKRGETEAVTDFPLSVNLETNELVVTTAAGERTVTVLPDQAVQNMLAANVIDQLPSVVEGAQGQGEATESAGFGLVSPVAGVIALAERQGLPVYEIAGVKRHKLLGFIPIETERTAVVSAETGELVGIEEVSLIDRVVDLLSTD